MVMERDLTRWRCELQAAGTVGARGVEETLLGWISAWTAWLDEAHRLGLRDVTV